MNRFHAYINSLSGEEKANTLTHLLSLVASSAMAWPMMRLAWSQGPIVILGTALFIIGMAMMFASSTLYHAVTHPAHKKRLRVLDHISIYVMIAGSYSLICLTAVGGWAGWTLFSFQWICVLLGTIGKCVALGKHPRLSLALYLAMGWLVVLVAWPLWHNIPHAAFWWIVAEGVFYTVGAYFFHGDKKHAYWHATWHVFITLGAMSHSIATWLILSQ